jgi:hypothetical protein
VMTLELILIGPVRLKIATAGLSVFRRWLPPDSRAGCGFEGM